MKKRKIVLLITAVSCCLLLFNACGVKGSEDSHGQQQNEEEQVAEKEADNTTKIEFPYIIEGKLSVQSIFSSDFENPDAVNQMGEDIVTIEAINISDQCIAQADISVELSNGTIVPIAISYLPAGEKVWAFATNNSKLGECIAEEIGGSISESDEDKMLKDIFETTVSGTSILIKNISNEEQKDVKVYCHTKFNEALFGGITYTYAAGDFVAGETKTIEADDCWLGEAEVVCIEAE